MSVFSQHKNISLGFWNITRLGGELTLKGTYRDQEIIRSSYHDWQKSSLLSGSIMFKSQHNIINQNFIILSVNGEYNPQSRKELYIVIPNQSEIRNFKKIDFTSVFLPNYIMNLTMSGGYSESFSNRENLSNLKNKNKNFYSKFYYKNKIAPLTIIYSKQDYEMLEIQTGRYFTNFQNTVKGSFNKSFNKFNVHELSIFHNNYIRRDGMPYELKTFSDNFILKNKFPIDLKRRINFNSDINGINNKGYNPYSRLISHQKLLVKIPLNNELSGNYNYLGYFKEGYKNNNQYIRFAFSNQYYLSVHTELFYEINKVTNTIFDEKYNKFGVNFNYIKKISTGKFTLSYSYYRQLYNKYSEVTKLIAINESHALNDGQIILLTNPNVDINSVVVKNQDETIIYQENFDYLLIKRDLFIEIQRIPGGQIANNDIVYADYSYFDSREYSYNSNNNQLSASVKLLKNFIEIYYSYANNSFDNINIDEYTILNIYNKSVYGTKLEYKIASGGVEYSQNKGTILPNDMYNYFLNLRGNIGGKFGISLSSNLIDYKMYPSEMHQVFKNVNLSMRYSFTSKSTINFDAGYRNQNGLGVNIELWTSRIEFSTNYRNFSLKLGLDAVRNNNNSNIINFNGAHIFISRKFN